MPCAEGSLCVAKPDHTPGPLLFTTHKCRVYGSFLRGLCGLPDPQGDNEMQRVCHGCVNNRKESSADPAAGAASSKRSCPEGQGTRKEKRAGAPRKKSRGANEGSDTQAVVSPRPPPYTEVAGQFGDLERIAERCSMAEVSHHLRKAKLAWMSEFGSKKTKQTCMSDFL